MTWRTFRHRAETTSRFCMYSVAYTLLLIGTAKGWWV